MNVVVLVLVEGRGNVVNVGNLERQELQEELDHWDLLDHLAKEERLAKKVNVERLAHQAPKGDPDLVEVQEVVVRLEKLVVQAILELLEQQGDLVHKVSADLLGSKVNKVKQEKLALLVLRVDKAHKDPVAREDQQEKLDQLGLLGLEDLEDLAVRGENQEKEERLVQLEGLDKLVDKDQLVPVVLLENVVNLVNLEL